MPLHSRLIPLAMAAFVAVAPQALRAEAGYPEGSWIANNSKQIYRIRISDDLVPVGVIRFYEQTSSFPRKVEKLITSIQSKDEYVTLEPGKKVKMVICGSPAFQDQLVLIYVSLDLMDGKTDKVKTKSVSRIHLTHGLIKNVLQAPSDIPEKERKSLFSKVVFEKEAITVKSDNEQLVTTNPKAYMKPDAGNLWTIK